jgi:D-alanine-D-alanine ligase
MDYIITDKKIFLLEVNTTPGMTPTSFIPQQVKAMGMSMQEVITEIIEDAIERQKKSGVS